MLKWLKTFFLNYYQIHSNYNIILFMSHKFFSKWGQTFLISKIKTFRKKVKNFIRVLYYSAKKL